MWVLCATMVAVLVAGCFDKPRFVGARDGGPEDGPEDGPNDAPGACAWRQFANIRTYLPLDDVAGSTTVIDMSMAGNNGQPLGALMLGVQGKIGEAAFYGEGADAAVRLSSTNAFDNLTAITACAWVWLDRLPTSTEGASTIVDKSENGYDRGWNLYVQAAGPRVGFLTPWGHYIGGQPNVVANEWMHVCATWNGTDGPEGILLYRNGVLDPVVTEDTLNKTARGDDDPYPLVLGRASNISNLYSLFGKLDEFFLYEAVLSPEAIKSLYQCAP